MKRITATSFGFLSGVSLVVAGMEGRLLIQGEGSYTTLIILLLVSIYSFITGASKYCI